MLRSGTHTSLSWQQRPLRELMRLAWPITVSMLSVSFMTAVDTLLVGHLGAAALAGVALGGIATFTVMCFGSAMMRGTKIAVAQAIGAGHEQAVLAYLGASLCAAAIVGTISLLVGEGVALLLPVLTSGPESGAYARDYCAVRMLGAPLFAIVAALREVRYGQGDARSPMLSVIAANVVNAVFASAFVFGFGWGVKGAAAATLVAQLVETGMLTWLQRARGFGLRAFQRSDLHTVLRLGVPLGIERVLDAGSFSLVVALFARMGDQDLAAHQVAQQAFLFVLLPMMALGDATCVLVGQALGAGSSQAIAAVRRSGLMLGYAYVAACSGSAWLLGPQIAGIFTTDHAVITRAAQLLAVSALFLWLLPTYTIAQASLRGLGDVRAAALITVAAAWVGAPIFAAVFGFGFDLGAVGGWMGIGVEFLVAVLCFWWRLRRRHQGLALRPTLTALEPVL